SDQHRGWFQSSMFSSMIIHGKPCAKTILTHGFTIDEKHKKMSKSIGNVIAPESVAKRYGTDVLRLWAAGTDFERDVVVSDDIFKNVAEVFRKIRNTCRFMVSNLYDFAPQVGVEVSEFKIFAGKIPVLQLSPDFTSLQQEVTISALDRFILGKTLQLSDEIRAAYSEYHFTSIVQKLNSFCTHDLSACYLDIVKDRLYVEAKDGALRKSAQKTLSIVLDIITKLMAPVLSFLAEEISDHYQGDKKDSIHVQSFADRAPLEQMLERWDEAFVKPLDDITEHDATKLWPLLELVRSEVLRAIEDLREVGTVKHSLESSITLFIDGNLEDGAFFLRLIKGLEHCEGLKRFFKDWFIISEITFAASEETLQPTALPWLFVQVERASGIKCPRCWHWEESGVGNVDGLCGRCQKLVC
ncbi:class I tRNA ligase family protein, partial [Candidatus Babeliales bacterium]|nr:class I tRNA ligase family protein [Candidatus Babeliales bacterium]